jgi:hypothetical protein
MTNPDYFNEIALDATEYPILSRFAQTNHSTRLDLMRHTDAILRTYANADNFRDLLIDPYSPEYDDDDSTYDMPLTRAAFAECAEYLRFALDPQNLLTELITELALSLSLCPLHRCDYACCFDDDDAECAQIRMIHPNHDT